MTMASKFEIWKLKMNHPWHVAKTRFETLLSEVLNSLEKSSWLQKRACHGVVPHNGATCPTSTQLLRLL